MRQDCKFYQSRSYSSGDTMRKCSLDLAPEAPWKCPADCSSYERRIADVNWRHGSLVTPKTPDAPESVGEDDSVAELLDEAENIINSVAGDLKSEVDSERAEQARKEKKSQRNLWWPFNRKT